LIVACQEEKGIKKDTEAQWEWRYASVHTGQFLAENTTHMLLEKPPKSGTEKQECFGLVFANSK
jgi:hypothetical protein